MEEGCGDREAKNGGGEEDMDVGECSEEEEDDDEDIEMGSSPIQQESSSIMDVTSPVSQPYEGLASSLRMVPPTVLSVGKPLPGTGNLKRGPGRPRSRGAGGNTTPTTPRPAKKPAVGLKLKRWKGLLVSGVYGGGGGKNGNDGEADGESSSPSQPSTPVDQLKGPIFVDEPRFEEQWPGKTCALCNLSEHSQLGQGKMLRSECSLDELPRDLPRESLMSPPETPPPHDSTFPRPPLQNRRQKGFSKFSGQEPVDELSLVGHVDIPEPSSIVDGGYIYVHEWCGVWLPGVSRDDNGQLVGLVTGVASAVARRCYHCSRYGAGPPCVVPSCNKSFHVPCAAAAAAFQHVPTLTLICSQHQDHVPINSNFSSVVCHSCNNLGNVSNLVMCSVCGNHHHGGCIGNALQPGLRAGWQCIDCRVCQLCREAEDTGRMLVCDSCDKAYHPNCVRPPMSSVPKVGWKCKRCRLCSDCGARTPGGGLSSRWHSNYTVCDSCYQQRNKGFSCPICHKAYRAAALREMVKCSQCRKFVHGTCDKEADFVSYHRKKNAHPDYQYICLSCKNSSSQSYVKRKDSTEDVNIDSTLNVSQESLATTPDDVDADSEKSDDGPMRLSAVGLGKGKPFYASKIAKKKLGLGPGRPKGTGKMSSVALSQFQKRPRYADFGRKRGAKTKMRGIFGVPGLGLQRPSVDSNSKPEDEPGLENKLVLVSARDKFVLSQDLCVMCGALGLDQEACLIACSQCGQSYHPYCVSVKVTKIMLQRGWRCLDCTVCEGCGQRNDEGRLILCDDCDISYHIYCMDPPLGSVPTGVWKCKWCAQCQTCGANTPGSNSSWQSNFTQCGPCASRTACPACLELYTDGDLIIKCIHCERWLHCLCDTISNESEAEACCTQGYTCILCRPQNVALVLPSSTPNRIPSPELPMEGKPTDYYVDGVCLSETGLQVIKNLSLENGNQPARRKRPGFRRQETSDLLDPDLENGEEKNAVYKDGMFWASKENGPIPSPPEGFSLHTKECGMVILRRRKQRNLQKLGIGGFSAVKMRSSRFKDDDEHLYPEDRPKRKPRCNKKRSKIAESYPSYLQEAFFGKELLDVTKESTQELESSTDDSDDGKLRVVDEESPSQDNLSDKRRDSTSSKVTIKEEEGSDTEGLKDPILHLPDIVNTIMNESADSIKSENLASENGPDNRESQRDELSEILGPNFTLESLSRETGLPNMDSSDVEEIFKSVVTDGSSRGSAAPSSGRVSSPQQQQHGVRAGPPSVLSPSSLQYPSASPYNSEYSNSPQFSPEGPWDDAGSYNRATSMKMEADESLGREATMSPVLYANMSHPEWRLEYPNWNERYKQILKKWKNLPMDEKAPYRQRARENRTNVRIRKQDQEKALASKTCREAEQERQWKQLQTLRQQQQMMSQVRAQQVGQRVVHRPVSSDGVVQFTANEPVSSPHLTQQLQVSTPQDGTLGALGSPRSQFAATAGGTVKVAAPGTLYRTVRPPLSPFPGPRPPPSQQEEIRHLRDLLQRHHAKQQEASESVVTPGGILQGMQMRQPPQQPPRALHPQSLQSMEPRVRLVVQQQQAVRFSGQQHVRIGVTRTQLQDQFLIQRQFAAATSQQHPRQASAIIRSGPSIGDQIRLPPPSVDQRIQNSSREGEEIPESVTAELEKLEEENGPMGGEADEVSAIFSGLVEDDDELLAEMGADFNILEYADPELDTVSGGDKTNILDDLEEVDKKKEDVKRNENQKSSSNPSTKVPSERPESKPSEEGNKISGAPTQPQLPQQISVNENSAIPQPKIVETGYQNQFVTPSTPLPRVQVLQQAGGSQVGRGGGGYVSIPPPPPPPYPGPPPPYPGQQTTIRGAVARSALAGQLPQTQQRRPLLLQEQPLLLEDLLEAEKREQEKASVTPSPASSLMSDADFEMLRADVLGSRTSSPPAPQPPHVPTLNLGPPPPQPPENIVTEADRQAQVQYETWLRTTGTAVSQQIRYFETEVQKLRKIRKSLNSKQRQLRKNGNELAEKDAIELQRVTGEQNVLQKQLEAARKQSRQHTMVMQEYHTKHENKGGGGSVGSASPSPQSPLLSPAGGGGGPQSHQPSPQHTSLSPIRHSPASTPHSQSGDDKSESGLPSPRPPPISAATPPSPHQFHQIRHPSLVPRFARSPEGALRPRLTPLQTSGFSSPRGMSPQPPSPQTLRLTPQQQQLLLQRQQLQQQKQQLLSEHPEAGAILSRQLMRQQAEQRQFRGFPGPQSPGSQGGSPLYSPRAPQTPQPPQSPMVYQGHQTPTSPMPQFTQPTSPMQSPRLQYAPSSPLQQQYRPNSPMVPSPLRRPSSASPQSEGGGGGNPFNPNNPIPLPPEVRKLKLGLRGGSPMWSDKRKRVQPGTSSEKVASLVCVDYNEFDEESPPMSPPSKPALIKKTETVKTRQSEDTDSEMTVYDDIVLVDGCKETSLEVEELQSALEGNVMTAMPMVLDSGHIQMMEVEGELVDDLLVLGVGNGTADNDLLNKDFILNDDGKEDDIDEDGSPPRGRMVGKVLPGGVTQNSPSPESRNNCDIFKKVEDNAKKIDKERKSSDERSVPVQPNVVVSRTPTTFTPVVTQKSIPIVSDNRQLALQQATVASLVQDAVNAAKLAAEAQKCNQNNDQLRTPTSRPSFAQLSSVITSKSVEELINNSSKQDHFKPEGNRFLSDSDSNCQKELPEVKHENKFRLENSSDIRVISSESSIIKYKTSDSIERHLTQSSFDIKRECDESPEKRENKISEQSNSLTSPKIESVALPCVSSSILEAQLTSMLRTTEPNPNQKYIYAFVNHSINKEQRRDDSQDDLRMEGLPAHFQRTIKNEDLRLTSENDLYKNSRNAIMNKKHGIYVSSPIKHDTVMVGMKSYKIFQAGSQSSTSDILTLREEKEDANGRVAHKVSIIERRLSGGSDKIGNEILQQRVVSSSEATPEKETHHLSFGGPKPQILQQKDEPKKFVSLTTMLQPRNDEKKIRTVDDTQNSQNVLLKQLLQNTACATTTAASSLPIVPSLEAQLARPVPPTPSALLPSVLNEPPQSKEIPQPKPQVIESSVESLPRQHIGPNSLDELLSPPQIQHQSSQQQQVQQQPQQQQQQLQPHPSSQSPVIKREPVFSLSQPGPVMTPMVDVKREVEVKKEVMSSDEMLSPSHRMDQSDTQLQEMKKLKRRQYQQKRRQSGGKEPSGVGVPKKRPRKSSKVEEDYDSFIDSIMHQLRQLPAMSICEPNLTYNFTGCPPFGAGDMSKVNSSTRLGELRGNYGNAYLPHENDYYNTLPFGDLPPKAPSTPATQRGFYNEEFAPLKLHTAKDDFDDRKYDYNRDRDNDTPDTIISSSSPECIMPEFKPRFPGLQLIDSDGEEEKTRLSRFSPDIPIIAPLAIRPKPIRFYSDMDKENETPDGERGRIRESVTVTLTLTAQAADDVMSVLRNLANVLRIPVPTTHSITERSSASHRLGLYRVKSKDGKEGAQIDIQSILNGAAKFCRHCDVVILNNLTRKKASETPLMAKQGDEDIYFCSSSCYMQLALTHPQITSKEKALPLSDHHEVPNKKIKIEPSADSTIIETKKEMKSMEISSYVTTRSSGKKENKPCYYSGYDKSSGSNIFRFDNEKEKVKKAPLRFRTWTSNSIPPPTGKHKKPTDKEMTEMLFKCGITVMPLKLPEDSRKCLLCHQVGDGVTDGPARLLNYDVNKWIHLNCALWSDEVYETVNGGLMNVEVALQNGMSVHCAYCDSSGATLKCYKMRCSLVYHLPCAVKDQCVFYKNKTLYCSSHVPKNEKENELTTLSVMRRVYISRDENRQVAAIMHHSEQTSLLRVGSLIFLSVGQLLPHQLQAFHTPNYIYPIGYKIVRMYWSMRTMNKRCRYVCSIGEVEGRPEFRIRVEERGEAEVELKDVTARGVWMKVLEPLAELRRSSSIVQLFTKYVSGEDLFGLTEPAIVRVLESLPGIETLSDYKFKYGRNPLLELPLAVNPTGCARSEGKPKGWKRSHTQRATSLRGPVFSPSTPLPGELACPYSKQFVHSKSSQYKKMKLEWRNNVYLARSKIQGLGLYAARDLERHTMVIEYIGEIIRTELAETREKQYEAKNRGIYMFRLDEERVVDATLCGGLARYINHSCSPNCVAETVEVERDLRIIIFTKRRISRGEELAYDYKFDIEDDQHKIPCMCGAPNCRKWMN